MLKNFVALLYQGNLWFQYAVVIFVTAKPESLVTWDARLCVEVIL
ncbi:hypothetical protein [Umezakia ovalisporum]|jgi:hypothetical protein|uniref:Uncharacterized protein n=2 Tax=Umezakia ovalisporum TaxID=75695 RepID=A0AA43H1L4_9CYAN|nr:hypothetical protein [Umezakia ovalisporum]MDH6056183.1 hypothetical protein [Umezakia ovalisporum FSS-43]MDH6065605.1 hypothetical protein [Umezakia ovalisporum FSS-62]MDH6065850.1 hypothetical protein [Umezakia ovalisporum APH033B]MDH6072124.1 hypothetical protein [Umezakia ovalisporum CobakiLakeA]MDH6074017.1 hypothetical protein [Umezakia ovalisporum CS-1034]